MSYFVYVLQSERDGSYYIGQTQDVVARLERHNRGGAGYTRAKIPYKLIYVEEFWTRGEAMKREKEIKAYKGGSSFKKLLTCWDGGVVNRNRL